MAQGGMVAPRLKIAPRRTRRALLIPMLYMTFSTLLILKHLKKKKKKKKKKKTSTYIPIVI
ncbi:hypothetical protein HanIR_Chr06g0257411 [Helianthus annuus]|nr:hypothetical protein HanIR_Chr06g0257411 [Helianthus annuus]